MDICKSKLTVLHTEHEMTTNFFEESTKITRRFGPLLKKYHNY